jgi:hypothetical protein
MREKPEPFKKTVSLHLHISEWEQIKAAKGAQSTATYVRERLGLDPPAPSGRRWPSDPVDRRWRTREVA